MGADPTTTTAVLDADVANPVNDAVVPNSADVVDGAPPNGFCNAPPYGDDEVDGAFPPPNVNGDFVVPAFE